MLSKFHMALSQYGGMVLGLIAATATMWLAWNGHLDLYIHPRYIFFSTLLAVILLVGILVALLYRFRDLAVNASVAGSMWLGILTIVSLVMLIVLPPKTLTTASVAQRGINMSGATNVDIAAAVTTVGLFDNNNYSQFSIKDWAALLSQTKDPSYFTGKTVDLTGFVSASGRDPDNVFFISRFVISCCAVDALPIGVPVYMPGWQKKYADNQWVRLQGKFIVRDYYSNDFPSVIKPDVITLMPQPGDPYVY